MYAAIRNHFERWLFQLRGPEPGVVVLLQRRVFILPTRQGLMFAAMLLLMLTGSINYNLSLGFILTFLLGSMGITTIIHTFRNLANLRVAGGRARAVFAGDTAHFIVHLENAGDMPRYAINLTHDKRDWTTVDIPARTTVATAAGVPVSATDVSALVGILFIIFLFFKIKKRYLGGSPSPNSGSPLWSYR